MQCGDDGEGESGAQKRCAGDPYPAHPVDLQQENKEDRSDLRKRVGFAKDAGTKIAQPGDGKEHGAGSQDGNVAAENQHRELPLNLVQDREHQEHRAQQEFVGDRIEILAEQGLLVEGSGEQAVEAVAEARDDENNQRP